MKNLPLVQASISSPLFVEELYFNHLPPARSYTGTSMRFHMGTNPAASALRVRRLGEEHPLSAYHLALVTSCPFGHFTVLTV